MSSGLIDSHAHPSTVTDLQSFSRYGVTTALTMACFSPELCRSLQNQTGLTDVLLASAAAAAPGSTHGNITLAFDKTGVLLVQNSSVAPAWVRNQVSWGADYIKVVAESPGLDQATLNALTTASHVFHKRAVCHAAIASAYEQAIAAKVDQIHHSPLDRVPDAQLLAQIAKQHQVSTPTLTIMQAIAAKNPQMYNYTVAQETVRIMHQEKVPVYAGTDANLVPGLIAEVPFGSSLHQELELLVEAGLSPVEALNAATSGPARYWGLHDRGSIEPGKRADLLLVDGDPTQDIKATRNIKRVWVNGIAYTGPLGTF